MKITTGKSGGVLEALEVWHATHIQAWFAPRRKYSIFLIAVAVCLSVIAISLNGHVRQTQLDTWISYENETGAIGKHFYTTADAPFFLALADTLANEGTRHDYSIKRHYPNRADTRDRDSIHAFQRYRDVPLLSVLIAKLSPDSSRATLFSTALNLVTASSIITAVFIIVAFAVAGFWLEGSIAALGGGLSTAYLVRSAAGRIDSDQLNLGFIYLLCGLNLVAARACSRQAFLIWCLGIGTVTHLFMWWYPKQELAWIVAASLAWFTFALRRNVLDCLLGVVIILCISSATFSNPLGNAYLVEKPQYGNFEFLSTLSTITETAKVSLQQILIMATGSIEMGLVCMLGLVLWAVRHPVLAVGFGPLAVFGLLNFILGNRAVFYSAPMLWFGFGFLIFQFGTFVNSQLSTTIDAARQQKLPILVTAAIAIAVTWVNSATSYLPRPVFDKKVLDGFARLEKSDQVQAPIVATWWDYGYSSMFLNRLPTIHDGGTQNTPATHFFARILLDASQARSQNILSYLSTHKLEKLINYENLKELEAAIHDVKHGNKRDFYLVLTGQMASWMGAISKIGNWDIEKGQPVKLRGNPDGPTLHYQRLNCRFDSYPKALSCQGVEIDLQRGLIGGRPLMVGWTHTKDGAILRRRSFDYDTDHAIQIIQDNGRLTAYFLHRQLYESTFNKLFYQGLIESPSISLHYDDYPHIRIYRIDGDSED